MKKKIIHFYIRYGQLSIEVVGPREWIKYLSKLYENSGLIRRHNNKSVFKEKAVLVIKEKRSSSPNMVFITNSKDLRKYHILASSDPLFLFLSVHQFIARIFNILHHLAGGFVLHSSVVVWKDQAYLFVGESGRGKSTIADILSQKFGGKIHVIGDNSAFIKEIKGQFYVFPSPYIESNRVEMIKTKNRDFPFQISKVYFPYHAKFNNVVKIDFFERLALIRRNSHISYRPEVLFKKTGSAKYSRSIFKFINRIEMFKLEFDRNKPFLYNLLDHEDKI